MGRKRRWKTGRTLFVIFLLTFASVMIYSFIVEVPKVYASQTDAQLQQEKVYYFYEDHIGKPIAMSEYQDYDGDGNLYFRKTYDSNCQPAESTSEIWRTNFEPFGVDDYSFNSAGIDVGAGEDCHSTLEGWLPPFRFPGQYADPELLEDFVYNHWRFYMPEIGRYTSPDPLKSVFGQYIYSRNNPSLFIDPYGLDFLIYQPSPNNEYMGKLYYIQEEIIGNDIFWQIVAAVDINSGGRPYVDGTISPHMPYGKYKVYQWEPKPKGSAYCRDKRCYFFPAYWADSYENRKCPRSWATNTYEFVDRLGRVGIHPDGLNDTSPGTHGCLGMWDSGTAMDRWKNLIGNYIDYRNQFKLDETGEPYMDLFVLPPDYNWQLLRY